VFNEFYQEDAPKMYIQADVLLHLQYNDACPTVPMEAMACGVPVVGLRCGGMPEIVKEGAGILLDVEQSYEREFFPTVDAIVDAIVRVMKNRKEYSMQSRKIAVRDFGKESWIEKHEEIFNRVLGR
jgi:glycosyltransferase involved in cell wall biosynthesis